jgi:hypothetical protein
MKEEKEPNRMQQLVAAVAHLNRFIGHIVLKNKGDLPIYSDL